MKRRTFLIGAVSLPLAWMAGSAVAATVRSYDLSLLKAELAQLPLGALNNPGEWNVSQMLQHCAQSIRYSYEGYPTQFSPAFQQTLGRVALNSFRALGSMRHDLNEAIPGGEALIEMLPINEARQLLLTTIEQFEQWQGPLKPHFAYGELSKESYAAAHYLHVRNHLDALMA